MKTFLLILIISALLQSFLHAEVIKINSTKDKKSRKGRVIGLLSLLADISQGLYFDADLLSEEDDRDVSVKTKVKIQPNYFNPYLNSQFGFVPSPYFYQQGGNGIFYPDPRLFPWIPPYYNSAIGFNPHSTKIIKNKYEKIHQEQHLISPGGSQQEVSASADVIDFKIDPKEDQMPERFTRQAVLEPIEHATGSTLDFRGEDEGESTIFPEKEIEKEFENKIEIDHENEKEPENQNESGKESDKEPEKDLENEIEKELLKEPQNEIEKEHDQNSGLTHLEVELIKPSLSISTSTSSSFEIGQAEFIPIQTTPKPSSYYRQNPCQKFDPEKITFTTWYPQSATELPVKEHAIFKPSYEFDNSEFKPISSPVSTTLEPLLPPVLPYYH